MWRRMCRGIVSGYTKSDLIKRLCGCVCRNRLEKMKNILKKVLTKGEQCVIIHSS